MVDCPVPLCEKTSSTKAQMRRHFCTRHYDQGLYFNGETTYGKCELCTMFVRPTHLTRHQRTQLCHQGSVRRQTRTMIAAAQLPAPSFSIGEDTLERVTKFRYLGRILSQDDHDLSACVRNIQRAKGQWAAISRVLHREGASKKSFARFYLVIVSTVLLYGSDTWVVTRRMEDLLTFFTTAASDTSRVDSFVASMPRKISGSGRRLLEFWRKPCCCTFVRSCTMPTPAEMVYCYVTPPPDRSTSDASIRPTSPPPGQPSGTVPQWNPDALSSYQLKYHHQHAPHRPYVYFDPI